jgi:hypothetical protein
MENKGWHVIYWVRGQSPSTAVVLTPEPVTYREARAKAKRTRFIREFFGCVVDVRRA